jgi:hypothetical protein
MGHWLEKYAGSLRFWILIIVATYFAYSVYYAASGMRDSVGMLSNQYIYTSLSGNSWWWMILFYGSEGVSGSVSIISRAVAGAFAVYAAFLFWKKKDTAISQVRKNACVALMFEALFFLALIPSIIAAAIYNLSSENLFYFGHTPGILLIYGTLVPCLAIVITVPPLLLKLRSTIKHEASNQEIIKWSSLVAVAYLFFVFWFNYSMLWAGVTVPYNQIYEQWGLDFVLQPANMLSFCLTIFGLLALAVTALITTLPAIKKQTIALNLTRIGTVMTAFGGYFIFNVFYYYLTGGYSAHPSVWYEVIGPLHNPNLWAIALVFLGVPLVVYDRKTKQSKNGL